jgi:signal transduction histidine kinase
MSLFKSKYCCLFVTIIVAVGAAAQGNFTIKHFTTENGLPQNSVRDAAVDKLGFLWLGTENGLARFDGQSFRIFNLSNTAALQSTDRISYIASDSVGRLYFNTGAFHTYTVENISTIKMVGTREYESLISLNNGLNDYERYKNSFLRLQAKAKTKVRGDIEGPIHNRIFKINPSESYIFFDSVYFMRENSLLTPIVDGKNSVVRNDTLFHTNANRTTDVYVKEIKLHSTLLFTGEILADGLYGEIANPINIIVAKNAWLAQIGNNYYRITRVGNSLQTVLLFKNLVLPAYDVFLYDQINDQYIVCTVSNGFFLVKASTFTNILEQFPNKTSFKDAFSAQILLPGDSILLNRNILFDKNGIQQKSGKYWGFAGVPDTAGTYWYNMDADWTTLDPNRIQQLDRNLTIVSEIKTSQKSVELFCRDSATGTVWCASLHIINKIDPVRKTLEEIVLPQFEKEKIWFIGIHSKQLMWVGTDNGIYLLNLTTRQLKKINGSNGKTVRNVLTDAENNIAWVGTYGSGPFYIKNDSLYGLPLDNKRNLLYTHYFVKDKNGYVWMPTNNGLYQASVKELIDYTQQKTNTVYYHCYNSEDGFASNEFNGGYSCPWVLRGDGLLSLCSMKGLLWFKPENIQPDMPDRPLYIDWVRANGKDSVLSGDIRLPNNYSQLNVKIATPFFGNTANLKLEYRLSGGDDDWIALPANNIISLSRLAPGNYTLEVRSMAGFSGQYNTASQSFLVMPAWYQTGWFYLLVAVVLVLLILFMVRLRLNALLRRKKELEGEVASRTASLNETVENYKQINGQLEAAQEQLLEGDKTKEEMIAIILHDLWSPLKFIAQTSASIAGNKGNYTLEEYASYVNNLSGSTNNILHLTEQLLKWMRSQHGAFAINIKETNVSELLGDIAKLYKEIAMQRGNQISIDCDSAANILTDATVLTLIIRNMVDNSNKNTRDGNIVLTHRVTAKQGDVISVKDNGRGMSEETLQKVRELAFQETLKSSSLGFRFAFEFARLLKATIDIESAPGSGTEVHIYLPKELPIFSKRATED